ncbi:hypothetical protein ACSBR2_032710 [Camellia fascicularis]
MPRFLGCCLLVVKQVCYMKDSKFWTQWENRLKEAIELIDKAPKYNELNRVGMWGALLGACRIHGNLELACRAIATLFELEPQNAARHVMLSNIYAATGKWDDARQVRAPIEREGLMKEVAYSWVEVRNSRHQFVAKDKFHWKVEEICDLLDLLDRLADQMKDAGYLPHDLIE